MWPFSSAYPEVRIEDILDEYDYIIVGKYTTAFMSTSNFILFTLLQVEGQQDAYLPIV
jgi:hypothetical protein